MCEVKGITPSFLVGRGQKREQAEPCRCHQPVPQTTATEYAQRVLMVVGGIVLLASVNFLARVLLIVLVTLFAAVSCTAVAVTVRRRRRRVGAVVPAPLPAGPMRTVVTSVQVQAIAPTRRAAVAAADRDRSQVRR